MHQAQGQLRAAKRSIHEMPGLGDMYEAEQDPVAEQLDHDIALEASPTGSPKTAANTSSSPNAWHPTAIFWTGCTT